MKDGNKKIAGRYIFVLSMPVLVIFSCRKEPPNLEFDVSTSDNMVSVNDSITFAFSGNAENVTFYPGTEGSNYENRNSTSTDGNTLEFDFKSWVDDRAGVKDNVAALLVSTDFTGKADSSSISKATWTDITSRAIFSSGTDQTSSGTIDLSDFSATKKPVIIAFRYKSNILTPVNKSTRLVIRSINFNKKSVSGTIVNLSTMATTKWAACSFLNPAVNWTISSSQLLMSGSATELDDDWILSQPFDVHAAVPDKGINVKNIEQELATFTYSYDKPGVYKAVFVASNIRKSDRKEIVKEISITVE